MGVYLTVVLEDLPGGLSAHSATKYVKQYSQSMDYSRFLHASNRPVAAQLALALDAEI